MSTLPCACIFVSYIVECLIIDWVLDRYVCVLFPFVVVPFLDKKDDEHVKRVHVATKCRPASEL